MEAYYEKIEKEYIRTDTRYDLYENNEKIGHTYSLVEAYDLAESHDRTVRHGHYMQIHQVEEDVYRYHIQNTADDNGLYKKKVLEYISKKVILDNLKKKGTDEELIDYMESLSRRQIIRLHTYKGPVQFIDDEGHRTKFNAYGLDEDLAREHMRNGSVPEARHVPAPMTRGQLEERNPGIWIQVYRGNDLDLIEECDKVTSKDDSIPIFDHIIMPAQNVRQRSLYTPCRDPQERVIIALTEPEYGIEEDSE